MATFTYTPEFGALVTKKPAVRSVKFGDGYEQRIADGINNQLREYSLSFSGDEADIREIDKFLTEHGAVKAFSWTPQDTWQTGTFKCEEWSITVNGYWNQLSAKFQEIVA